MHTTMIGGAAFAALAAAYIDTLAGSCLDLALLGARRLTPAEVAQRSAQVRRSYRPWERSSDGDYDFWTAERIRRQNKRRAWRRYVAQTVAAVNGTLPPTEAVIQRPPTDPAPRRASQLKPNRRASTVRTIPKPAPVAASAVTYRDTVRALEAATDKKAAGDLGEQAAALLLRQSGYRVEHVANIQDLPGDLLATDPRTGQRWRVEVKAARAQWHDARHYHRWHFVLWRKINGGRTCTDWRKADVVLLLAVTGGQAWPFVIPVGEAARQVELTSHPATYGGKWAQYRQSPARLTLPLVAAVATAQDGAS